jgi:hypothetical protein
MWQLNDIVHRQKMFSCPWDWLPPSNMASPQYGNSWEPVGKIRRKIFAAETEPLNAEYVCNPIHDNISHLSSKTRKSSVVGKSLIIGLHFCYNHSPSPTNAEAR